MPIYEYQCQNCGHQLEKLQKINDAPLTLCPECQQEALEKLVSKAGFRLKGGGWYETDFKSDKETKRNIAGQETGDSVSDSSSGKDNKSSESAESKSTTQSKTTE